MMVRLLDAVPDAGQVSMVPADTSQASLPQEQAAAPDRMQSSSGEDGSDPDGLAFLPAIKLTRQPAPLVDIDLNAATADDVGIPEKIELALLIDETGRVVEVSILSERGRQSIFANHVAAAFRNARYRPGELNGVPAKSRLEITVITEMPDGGN